MAVETPKRIFHNLRQETLHCDIINHANTLLLNREFDQCLDLCLKEIGTAKMYRERPGSYEIMECLCAVALQSYAELNRWQEVLPFITQLYDGIEDCPAKIVHYCVLLYAYMGDFSTCTAIAQIWLRNPNNYSSPYYARLVETVIRRVLEPQNRLADAPALLQACGGLDPHIRETLKRYADYRIQEEESQECGSQQSGESAVISHEKEESRPPSTVANKFQQLVKKYIPVTTWYLLKKVVLLGIFVYWILTRANFDLLSNEKIAGIFLTLLRLWRSMFAPFHRSK